MGGWIGEGDATDEIADQAQWKKVKGRRPQESPSKRWVEKQPELPRGEDCSGSKKTYDSW